MTSTTPCPAEETITFALDGTDYEIDLSTAHAATMRDDLRTWVTHARRTSSSSGRARRSPTPAGGRMTSAHRCTHGRRPSTGGRGPRLGPQQRAHRLRPRPHPRRRPGSVRRGALTSIGRGNAPPGSSLIRWEVEGAPGESRGAGSLSSPPSQPHISEGAARGRHSVS